ncbi:MAG: ACP S-malonyltransferase [Liquorilactobacillus ghanensis]|uniref:ACP S-malonyltransferase n=1 Tax=Liquorilactobacillus ghanensis TaxID=399370 RepID=UPI0039E8F7FC
MKIGILFSGQGAQFSGMGIDFCQKSEFYRSQIEQLSQFSNHDLIKLFQNENQELNQTSNVQPAIVAMSLALFRLLQHDVPTIEVTGMIGLSLGEYSALLAAQAFDTEAGMQLLQARADYMQQDADRIPGAMAAVMKADEQEVAAICRQASTPEQFVGIANYNSPKQLVIGGEKTAVDRAVALLQEKGIKRVMPLKVNGAFHTPLFKPTSQKLAQHLQSMSILPWKIPVISNTTGVPFVAADLKKTLAQQVIKPTHFAEGLTYLCHNYQPDLLVELGPGKTLTRFAKQTTAEIPAVSVENWQQYQQFIEQMK